ncbi:acyl-CoA reductase-like NAD-dependent aldehyde dehydrogenase [Sagittula marina]|uniref:Acyl-CoA reductase-like NAD-dependent aldehyde dehydrogenase n=1 Tax=Sagittula marina TaxID=943940 RepID=A0A7W6DQD7_9RHOB|nr:acyl-CoA reductase-like NAD-dependent aldehyde dehydrogenase [Sagittula marina]
MTSLAALEKCHTAFSARKLKTLDERAQTIARIGEELTARKEEFAQ